MQRLRKHLRFIAAFLMVNTLYYTLYPSVAWATLTAGPHAPEAESFEPVDMTDMVNLQTGDFTYSIPLLEVPGPGGGYPVSLSYHSGIRPNQEASWIGLGWNLNPGAITRTVNNYPDDIERMTEVRRDYWDGGETTTHSLGTSFGVGGHVGVDFGVQLANDTYKGVGIGYSVGLSASLSKVREDGTRGPIGGSLSLGVGPYGQAYAGINLSVTAVSKDGNSKASLGGNIGLRTNFESVSVGAGGGISASKNHASGSLIGASISTSGGSLNGSVSIAGLSSSHSNSKAGKISSYSRNMGLSVPVPWGSVNYAYSYHRYWSDESSQLEGIGSLYPFYRSASSSDTYSYDSYSLTDPSVDKALADNFSADKLQGGSFPAYDQYNVAAQGLGGGMEPYIPNMVNLFRQNVKDERGEDPVKLLDFYEADIKDLAGNAATVGDERINFRFLNDFSNRRIQENTALLGLEETDPGVMEFHFENDSESPADGFVNNHLAGSKHIEYFTIGEIKNGTAKNKGFMDYVDPNDRESFKYNTNMSQQIGGFMITNESGVTYHYALPAYTSGGRTHTYKTDDPSHTYTNRVNLDAYAYTWYLTGVTGPDFVDRSAEGASNGMMDKYDWGYWVKFDYGLWGNYTWRNPGTGAHKDLDTEFSTFSYGGKELYYLNAISTKTHIALFSKEIRADGKSPIQPEAFEASYKVAEELITFTDTTCDPSLPADACDLQYATYRYPTATMKLDKIFLLKKSDFESIGGDDIYAQSSQYDHAFTFNSATAYPSASFHETTVRVHHGDNVLDIHDSNSNDIIKDVSLRVIDLDHNYSLQQNTLNSFDATSINYTENPDLSELPKEGKLTLTGVQFLGKKGTALTPPLNFEYNENPDYDKDAYDLWGYYKSDYDQAVTNKNETLGRSVTNTSAPKTASWSLSKIKSPTGADISITYEPDSYSKNVYQTHPTIIVEEFSDFNTADGTFKARVQSDLPSEILNALTNPTSNIYLTVGGILFNQDQDNNSQSTSESLVEDALVVVEGLNEDVLSLKNVELVNQLTEDDTQGEVHTFVRIYAGNVRIEDAEHNYFGGGLRVKDISVHNQLSGRTDISHYDYNLPNNPSLSSGITSYEPSGFDQYFFYEETDPPIGGFEDAIEEFKVDYKTELYKNFSQILALSRVIPSPGVHYEYVTQRGSIEHSDGSIIDAAGSQEVRFQVFDESFINYNLDQGATLTSNSISGEPIPGDLSIGQLTIQDFTSKIGRLISTKSYDKKGAVLIEETNVYEDDLNVLATNFANQGVVQHIFSEAKRVYGGNDDIEVKEPQGLKVVISKKEEYPSVFVKSTVKNYKTGITISSENLQFDFYTGSVLQTLSSDGYGNYYLSETLPAYTVPEYASMGLKVQDINNKNMLTQNAGTFVYKVSDPNLLTKEAIVSAQIETWNDHWRYREYGANGYELTLSESDLHPVWRKHKNFSWKGDDQPLDSDGLYPYTALENPTFSSWLTDVIGENTQWQKGSEITLYDRDSHALEVKDINEHYAATKMGYNDSKVIATTANGRYTEFAYSGAEDELQDVYGDLATSDGSTPTPENPNLLPVVKEGFYGGEVDQPEGLRVSATNGALVHTGEYSVKTTDSEKAFYYKTSELSSERNYRIAVWASDLNGLLKYSIDGSSPLTFSSSSSKQANGWYLIDGTFTTPASFSNVEIWSEGVAGTTIYFDDFKVQPLDAAMTAYVYDHKTDELTHIIGNNNLYTRYNYDAQGRLESTFMESFEFNDVKTSEVVYEYARNNTKFDITAAAAGGGLVTPIDHQVVVNGNTEIQLDHDQCALAVATIEVDGYEMQSSTESIGGTDFSLTGKTLSLSHVKGDHDIEVTYVPSGYLTLGSKIYFSCQQDEFGCPTGQVEYKTANGCGGYNEEPGIYSYEDSPTCCENPPTGCSACAIGGGSN